jgi:hypothetical protein
MSQKMNFPFDKKKLLLQHFELYPEYKPFTYGITHLRGTFFTKRVSKDTYIIDYWYYNSSEKKGNRNDTIPVGWIMNFTNVSTKEHYEISSESFNAYLKSGAIFIASDIDRESPEVDKILEIYFSLKLEEIRGVKIRLNKSSYISDLPKYLSSCYMGLLSKNQRTFETSKDKFIELFTFVGLWPNLDHLQVAESQKRD